MYLNTYFWVFYFYSVFSVSANINPRILELNDRFLDLKREENWLVLFYAPWCGHCRRLEPVWSHVQQSLHNSNIRVAKMDCSVHKNSCYKFQIQNYPTIKFLRNDDSKFNYNGDRQAEDIVHFALRLARPAVRTLEEENSIIRLQKESHIFFIYIGEAGDSEIWNSYFSAAIRFQQHSYFYHITVKVAKDILPNFESPSVVVYKDETFIQFKEEIPGKSVNDSLSLWINEERFPTFMKVTRNNINLLMETNKYLVLAVVQENKIKEIPPHMMDFRNMVESVIRNSRKRLQRSFQFGWIGNPDLANSITISKVPIPCLLVLNSSTNHHHIPDDDPEQLTPEAITIFLESVLNQSARAYGGNNILINLYRMYFEALTTLVEMWKGNPVLTALIIGLPFGFLTLILYSICCADIMDADEEDTDLDAEHEKKE